MNIQIIVVLLDMFIQGIFKSVKNTRHSQAINITEIISCALVCTCTYHFKSVCVCLHAHRLKFRKVDLAKMLLFLLFIYCVLAGILTTMGL